METRTKTKTMFKIEPAITAKRYSRKDSLKRTASIRNSYQARLMSAFDNALKTLNVDTDDDIVVDRIHEMSCFIYNCMSNLARNYHFVQHVFDLIEGKNASNIDLDSIAVLAALYHDCVYSNVDDGGLSDEQKTKLNNAVVILECNNLKTVSEDVIQNDTLLALVMSIFGFKPDQSLHPLAGQNEFLSAVIAVRDLQSIILDYKILAQIAVCIEATIPFRKMNDNMETAMDLLYQRLIKTSKEFHLGLPDDECVIAIQRAVLVANEDVANFGSTDHAWFLDNTWSLLPESNQALRSENMYTVQHFHFALYKMYGFFSFIRPEVIFQSFHGVPDENTLQRLQDNTKLNLQIGAKYVAAKLIGICFLGAIAYLSGGDDAPISLFMGDLPTDENPTPERRLENLLIVPPFPENDGGCNNNKCDRTVYNLLSKGRHEDTSFDLKNSPLAAYFYTIVGDDGIQSILCHGKTTMYPMTIELANHILKSLPQDAINDVGIKIANLATERKDKIIDLLQNL